MHQPSGQAPRPMTRPASGRTQVMGIVNVTPDSFSDGGRFLGVEAAIAHGLTLRAEGADILDVGGESTRPGAAPAPEAEEIARVVPVIEALRLRTDTVISIDTMKPAVARAAVQAGAAIWNDVTALGWSPDSPAAAAALGCRVVLMHMQGEPRSMQDDPRYDDVTAEVTAYLAGRADAAAAAGVAPENILIDPGIGFGKRPEHNLRLLKDLGRLCGLGFPLVLGVSRKRFIRSIDESAEDAGDRLGGSLAGALWGAAHGAAIEGSGECDG